MSDAPCRIPTWLVALSLTATAGLGAGGCGDSANKPPGSNYNPSAYERFLQERNDLLTELVCQSAFQCDDRPPGQLPYDSQQECRQVVADRAAQIFDTGPSVPASSLQNGRIRFRESKTDGCLQAIQQLIDQGSCRSVGSPTLGLPACEAVLVGRVDSGQPCQLQSMECSGGLSCVNDEPATCYGTCKQPEAPDRRIRSEGQSCTEPGDVCDPDEPLQCASTDPDNRGDKKCVREETLSEGTRCVTTSLCKPGLVCADETCQSWKMVGEGKSCDQKLRFCERGLACIGQSTGEDQTGTCKPFAAVGETCDDGQDCDVGLYCDHGGASASGTCKDAKGFGESCAENRCESHLQCLVNEVKGESICRFPSKMSCELPE